MKPDEKNVTPDHTEIDQGAAPGYRGLKALVIGLGLGIVAMLGLIFYTIAERATQSMLTEEGASEMVTVSVPSSLLSELRMTRPEGSELVSVSSSGSDLLLHFQSETGDIIIAVNRATGAQTRLDIPK